MATAELDEVMAERGFSRGQVGLGADGSQSVLYCISVDALSERWPRIFAYFRQQMGVEVCVDLTVGITETGAWSRADVEGIRLSELVAALVDRPMFELDVADLDDVENREGLVRIRRACEGLFPCESS